MRDDHSTSTHSVFWLVVTCRTHGWISRYLSFPPPSLQWPPRPQINTDFYCAILKTSLPRPRFSTLSLKSALQSWKYAPWGRLVVHSCDLLAISLLLLLIYFFTQSLWAGYQAPLPMCNPQMTGYLESSSHALLLEGLKPFRSLLWYTTRLTTYV